MITDANDKYEEIMKKQKAKIKSMVDNVETQIEELNLDNEDFKEQLDNAESAKEDLVERLTTLEMREQINKK